MFAFMRIAWAGWESVVCVGAIGDGDAPAIVLIGGAAWSLDWWEDELCRRLADRGRLIVRGARLIELDGVGHQLPPPHLGLLVDTLIEQPAAGSFAGCDGACSERSGRPWPCSSR